MTALRAADDAPAPSMAARIKELAGFVAPTTLVTALFVYFGYVGTRARFEYFGLYLDLTDLSNQDLLMYGLEVAYVPAALIFLVLLLAIAAHAAITWLSASPGRDGVVRIAAGALALAGLLLTARAVVGMLVADVSRHELRGTTAVALACGPALIAYGGWIVARQRPTERFTTWYHGPVIVALRRMTAIAVGGLVLAGLFWAANSFAAGYGANRGYQDALRLPGRPVVVLDTREPLAGLPSGVTETRLTADKDRKFQYRYSGLRLLLESGKRLFLVPEKWTTESNTLVVPYDDAVRVQLIPVL